MLAPEELRQLHTNQRLLVRELQRRGVDVDVISRELELLEASLKGHRELILDRDSSINPYAASVISGDKYLAKQFLRKAGVMVADGQQFFRDEIDNALLYAQDRGFPLVVKPVFGSHGYDVHMDLESLCDVKEAIDSVVESIGSSRAFLVEEQFEGREYRVFVTTDGDYAVLHRDPAHVIGDGERAIEEIAREESHRRMNPRDTCLCPVMLDGMAERYLARQGLSFLSVPEPEEKIYLRHNSNVAMGATCEDATDIVHASIIDISKRALSAFPGLPYAGIDFLSTDAKIEQTDETCRVIEVNSVPGIHMHMRPGTGRARDVASYIVDMMFPETRNNHADR